MANVNAFADASEDKLSTMMADPLRHQESGIKSAMEPLEDHGILDASRPHEFDSPSMTAEERARHRATALRHVLQVAYAEIDWLRARNEGVVTAEQLSRLDRLVDAAVRIQGDEPSRACLHVRAARAKTCRRRKLACVTHGTGKEDIRGLRYRNVPGSHPFDDQPSVARSS